MPVGGRRGVAPSLRAIQVFHTVELFERAGAAALQLEDQAAPKRCGHLSDKRLVTLEEMTGKIGAACAARSSRDLLVIAADRSG